MTIVATTPEQQFESCLETIQKIVRWTSARQDFDRDEREEFSSYVMLKLIEHDYRRIRSHRGESSLQTYLVTVIQRLAWDFLVHKNGRWRASTLARDRGDVAVQLEELVYRRGYSFGEAQEILRANRGHGLSRDELWRILIELPVRQRRVRVPEEVADRLSATDTRVHGECREVEDCLRVALNELSPDELQVVRLRFVDGLPAHRIALEVDAEPRQVYRNLDKIHRRLRSSLEARGITRSRVIDILGLPGVAFDGDVIFAGCGEAAQPSM